MAAAGVGAQDKLDRMVYLQLLVEKAEMGKSFPFPAPMCITPAAAAAAPAAPVVSAGVVRQILERLARQTAAAAGVALMDLPPPAAPAGPGS